MAGGHDGASVCGGQHAGGSFKSRVLCSGQVMMTVTQALGLGGTSIMVTTGLADQSLESSWPAEMLVNSLSLF